MEDLLIIAYLTVLALLAVYGFHRSQLVFLFHKTKKLRPEPLNHFDDLPVVTVQLPMFNEKYVAGRIVESMTRLDYPKNKLEIQVLDDSTDDTTDILKEKVEEVASRGFDIALIHRVDRVGFKAGALENGLKTAKGEFVAVFDADFIAPESILKDTIDYFTDEKVGMVQARWGHINRDYSMMTRIQSLMLDGHFVIEHAARNRTGRYFNFNGTAGIWRKKAIHDAGGWEHDTLTEDMDLSYRAQLKGWNFIYLPDVVAPAEIPVEMNSFKSQQFRWAKGSIQVARKMLPVILKSDAPLKVKLEAFFHLTNNFAYVLMIFLALLLVPNLLVRTEHGLREVFLIDLPLFFGTTMSIAVFYVTAHRALYPSLGKALLKVPLLMSMGIGMSINNAKAVIEGILGHDTEFVRTAKHGVENCGESWCGKKYRASKTLLPVVKILFGLYFILAVYVAIDGGHWVSLPFLLMFLFGYFYVGALSIYQRR